MSAEYELCSLRCDHCHSENVRRLAILYDEAVATTDTSIQGHKFARLDGKRPPELRSWWSGWLLVPLILALGSLFVAGETGFVVGFFLVAGTVSSIKDDIEYNHNVYPELKARWQRSCLCLRCYHGFVPSQHPRYHVL